VQVGDCWEYALEVIRDDDITIVSMTYIMSSMNIHYRQTCID